MRLLHTADLHMGISVNGFSMVEDQRHLVDELVHIVEERSIDVVVIPGDVYDKSAPSAEAVALVDLLLAHLADTGVPVLVSSGNHDSPERLAYASELLARQGVHLAGAYDGQVRRVTLEDEHGPVTFWLIPFLKPAHVRHCYPDAAIESHTDALRVAIDACEVDTSQRNVALSHQFVTSEDFNPMRDYLAQRGLTEEQVGGINNVDVSVYDAFDYVALGHIHRARRVGREEARYCGSPLKYSTSDGDVGDTKGVTIVDLGPKGAEVTIEHVAIEPLHDIRAIRGPLVELISDDVVSQGDPEDYLRVTLTDENPPEDALAQLRAVYPHVMQFLVDNARTQAPGAIAAENVERRSALDLFAEFYELQNGAEMDADQLRLVSEALKKVEVM